MSNSVVSDTEAVLNSMDSAIARLKSDATAIRVAIDDAGEYNGRLADENRKLKARADEILGAENIGSVRVARWDCLPIERKDRIRRHVDAINRIIDRQDDPQD